MNALYKSYVWCLPYLLLLSSPSIRRHEISRIINACTCSTFYSYIIIGTSMALCMYKYVCMCMCAWCTLQTLRLRSPGGGVMCGSAILGPSVMIIIILVHLLQPRRQRQNAIILFFFRISTTTKQSRLRQDNIILLSPRQMHCVISLLK
jgi:hypothetical protein